MTDERARQLLELLAEYVEEYGPNGTVEPGGPPPSDLLVSELAGDLRESLPYSADTTILFDRITPLGLI